MAALSELYIKTGMLEKILNGLKEKDMKGISLTVSNSDETNQYGQNLSAYVSQTKEQREAKDKRLYVGNGKTFWKDQNGVTVAERKEPENTSTTPSTDDDLPF